MLVDQSPANLPGDPVREPKLPSFHRRRRVVLGAALLLLVAQVALADTLWLRTGERLLGKVRGQDSAKVIFDSQALGPLEVMRDRIEKLDVDPVPPAPGALASNPPPALSGTPQSPPDRFLPWIGPAGPDNFDWIELNSGEWLKGRVKAMQDRKLEFDSDKLDALTFEWKDICQVRTPRFVDALFVGGAKVSGPVRITPDQITVHGAQPQTYPRDQLQSLTPGGAKERDYWSGNASLGLTLRAGNTRSVDYNAQAHLQRRTPATRLSLDYIGNISSIDDVESANNQRVNTEFDYWLSRRLYLIAPYAEYYTDPFQNLKTRLTGGVGVGYDLISRPKLEWNVTCGPAYQYAWFESAEPGAPTQKGNAALTFGSRLDWDITRRIELIMEYRGVYTSKEAGETTHHSVSTLSIEMTERLDLDVSLSWDRISNPKVGSDGAQPKPDDFRLVVGLGVDF